jgi:hypothetical protein
MKAVDKTPGFYRTLANPLIISMLAMAVGFRLNIFKEKRKAIIKRKMAGLLTLQL